MASAKIGGAASMRISVYRRCRVTLLVVSALLFMCALGTWLLAAFTAFQLYSGNSGVAYISRGMIVVAIDKTGTGAGGPLRHFEVSGIAPMQFDPGLRAPVVVSSPILRIISLPLWLPCLVLVLTFFGALYLKPKESQEACRGCGYCLVGSVARCPECGRIIPSEQQRALFAAAGRADSAESAS